MTKKYFFILCIILISCKSTNLTGIYSSNKDPYRFVFSGDSTFRYQYKEGLIYSYSFGSWKKVGNEKIELQSFYNNRALPLVGFEKSLSNTIEPCELKIGISIPDVAKKYYKCLLYIDGRLFKEIHCDSISSIMAPNPIKTVQLKITSDQRIPTRVNDTLITSKYNTNSPYLKQLDLKCSYNDSLFNYKLFNGTILNFTSGKLKFMEYRIPKGK